MNRSESKPETAESQDSFAAETRWLFQEILDGVPFRKLAEVFKVSAPAIVRYRDGKRLPQGSTARRIEEAVSWAKVQVTDRGLSRATGKKIRAIKKQIQEDLLKHINTFQVTENLPDIQAREIFETVYNEMMDEVVDDIRTSVAELCSSPSFEEDTGMSKEDIPKLQAIFEDLLFRWDPIITGYAEKVMALFVKEMWVAIGKGRKDSRTEFIERIEGLVEVFERACKRQV